MRLAWVTGKVTLNRREESLKPGSLLICEALDETMLDTSSGFRPRTKPMPESLVVLDQLGAGVGDLIAFTEGGEATQPFRPDNVPVDALSTAIIDTLTIQ
jgi:ethanolamine utilization protein EutN